MYFNTIKQIKERVIFLKGGILYAKVNKTKELSRKSEVITHEKQHVFFITETSRFKCARRMMAKAGSWGGHTHLPIGFGPTAGRADRAKRRKDAPHRSQMRRRKNILPPALLPELPPSARAHTHAHTRTHTHARIFSDSSARVRTNARCSATWCFHAHPDSGGG